MPATNSRLLINKVRAAAIHLCTARWETNVTGKFSKVQHLIFTVSEKQVIGPEYPALQFKLGLCKIGLFATSTLSTIKSWGSEKYTNLYSLFVVRKMLS